MNLKIILVCFILIIIACCGPGTEKNRRESWNSALTIDMPVLIYSDSVALRQVLEELETNYNFMKDTSEADVLYVRNINDSVFFDFTTFDKKYVGFLFRGDENIKKGGVITYKERFLIIFDEIGLFEAKNILQRIDFGYQLEKDLLFYEPLKYRCYLDNRGEFKFIEESWF